MASSTGDTHVDLENDCRIAIHVLPPQGPSYARKPNLKFRYGSVIRSGGRESLDKLADNLELFDGDADNHKKLAKWLEDIGHGDMLRKVWGQYALLKDGRL